MAKNKSSLESVNIHCKDINDSVFQAKLDKNKQEYTYQFCSGWADGMGYPGPGVKTQCKITFSNGNKLEFSFPSIDWGNMVTFIIFDDKVELNLQSPWSKKRFETKVFPLK